MNPRRILIAIITLALAACSSDDDVAGTGDDYAVFMTNTSVETDIEFDALGAILDDFAAQYIEENSGITMQLSSWYNKRHLSWD